jgi:DNA-binding SARP family transcriptional activator
MSALRIRLFGKFSATSEGRELEKLDACKSQELLCYLLVNRARPHPRESLAALLWGDATTEKSKKYLRQSLWHLQAVLEERADCADSTQEVLSTEHDWVRLNDGAELWLDVATFERAFAAAQGGRGARLDAETRGELRDAVDLYRGDLLEGWYQDWCLFERERLQNMYLLMLDRLLGDCDANDDYEAGRHYGALVLRQDRARERTHRQLMSLHYRAGDRTGALRQYERCAAALREELNVAPGKQTVELYRQIRADQLEPRNALCASESAGESAPSQLSLPEVLGRLRQLQQIVADAQQRIQQDIHAVEATLKQKASRALNRHN